MQGYGVQMGKKTLVEPNKGRIRYNVFGAYSAFYFYDKSAKKT
ncbi:MAG: hypothetical protein ACI9XO_002483, partial [Paraglaciecola sp.]